MDDSANCNADISIGDGVIMPNRLRFAVVTDTHIRTVLDDRYTTLQTAVTAANAWEADAFFHTGDASADSATYLQNVVDLLDTLDMSWYLSLGNHDEEETTGGIGNTNIAAIETILGLSAPLNKTGTVTSSDGTLTARICTLDSNIYADDINAYPPGDSPDHSDGDRIGYHIAHAEIYMRQFGSVQKTWLTNTLAGDTTSDMIIILGHYRPIDTAIADYTDIANIIQADGRPAIGFNGHIHGNAIINELSPTVGDGYNFYTGPGALESGSYTFASVSLSGGVPILKLDSFNYTDPGGWIIDPAFTTHSANWVAGADIRTLFVGADSRTRTVKAVNRTVSVGADSRTQAIKADSRTVSVGADSRTDTVMI